MTRNTTLTAWGLLATMAVTSFAPVLADGRRDRQQTDKNNARNIAIAGAAVAVYGLLSHNKTATVVGAAAGALGAGQYEKDRHQQSRDNDWRNGRGSDWNRSSDRNWNNGDWNRNSDRNGNNGDRNWNASRGDRNNSGWDRDQDRGWGDRGGDSGRQWDHSRSGGDYNRDRDCDSDNHGGGNHRTYDR